MDVALDTAPTGLFGLHDAGPRGRQLARLALDLGQTLRQLAGECRVPNGQRRLPAEGLEQLMVPGLERPLFLGATVDGADVLVGMDERHAQLLYHLASNPGRLMALESLLTKVWGYEYSEEDHYVRVYVSYLRQKIEPDPSHPRYILTVPGLGYKFVDYQQSRPIQASASTPRNAR